MGTPVFDVIGAYRQTWTTGAVTTIAAGTGSAGHIFSLRWAQSPVASGLSFRLRSLEVEFIVTTAFTAAQEVGFDVFKATGFSAAPTGATAITVGADAKKLARYQNSVVGDVRIANTGAMTAGTMTLDGQAIARGSAWMSGVGSQLGPRYYDFMSVEPNGLILSPGAAAANAEGLIIRNTILMGAAGVGKWHFTLEWDEGLLV